MSDNKNAKMALVLTLIMLVSPLASGISVTTFSDGNTEVTVEVRDAPDYQNIDDGSVSLVPGETVTSASVELSTGMATHEIHSTIDNNTQQFVWDPAFNNQQTEYSNKDDFTYNANSVSLVSGGLSTDFERDHANFMDTSEPVTNGVGWQHGSLVDSTVLNDGCSSGNDCWGTNMYDADNDYITDHNSGYSYSMISPAMEVDPVSFIAKFSSWHGLHWSQTGPTSNPTNTYYDCAYLMVRSTTGSPNNFPPPGEGWSYIPFDTGNSSGISTSNGLYPIGIGNGKIQSCDSLTGVDYALGGESTSASSNPNGWGTLAVNLNEHIGKYAQLKFVMSNNRGSGTPYNSTMPGWFIDDFRLGDPLPQSGWMTVKGFTPQQSPNPGFPDGYGILTLEQETTPTNSLTVDVLRGSTSEIVLDKNGNQMTGLVGPIIEMWDIDASEYPVVDLKLTFDTGLNRLSTSVLHGINIGTRIGIGLNDSNVVFDPMIMDGVWQSQGSMQPLMYSPSIYDTTLNPPMYRSRFSQPIVGITPEVVDDCSQSGPAATVQIVTRDDSLYNLSVGTKWVPDKPLFGFSSVVSYASPCGMSELWFDLEFGHNAMGVSLDIANDGDIEWGMNEPAFGSFGRQNTFWAGTSNGINYGSSTSSITLNSVGVGSGGSFMLPKGATVVNSDITFTDNTAYNLTLALTSGGQEESLGTTPNQSIIAYETMENMFDFTSAINSLLNNPLVPVSVIDEFGNQWITMHFSVSNTNAPSNSGVNIQDLDIIYDWHTTLDAADNLDRELNQGVALGGTSNVEVPFALSANSGGAIELSNLAITTATGYDSTLSLTGNPVGLYPNGEIIEAVSTHTVDAATGAAFAEARLRMESSSGVVELSYSDLMSFAESNDPDNLVTLESSSVSDVGNTKQITWRFIINTAWEDTAELRLYASLVADNGVNGLPGAVVLAPANGNAIENDAYIASFELQNDGGVAQDLDDARSNQNINLVGSVRLENLDVAPDPTAYNFSLQRWDINTTGGNVTSTWVDVANTTGVIGGNFNWNIDLGEDIAGTETYRFFIANYSGGDSLCPDSSIPHQTDCTIQFNLSIDTYSPTLVNISILKAANYDPTIWSNWRNLVDDTWVLPTNQQKVRVIAQDLPAPPSSLDMYYWVEYDHDADSDGEADQDEYVMITLMSDGDQPAANYTGTYSDDANMGQDPTGKVSIYVVGSDLGGNPIEGGSPGFDNDLVTYVSMSAQTPNIRNFFIENSFGERLHNPIEGQPWYQGPWNMTMYAGNEYHLIVEASDANGWRDIQYFEINLGPEDMIVYYSPRNETAWTDSSDIEIISASNDSDGTQLLRMDGGRLIDPFESEFYLDLPIKMNWNIIGIESSNTYTPFLRIKDMDKDPSAMNSAGGRHKQLWRYSDGIQLDFRDKIAPMFSDLTEPITSDISTSFVFPGDTIEIAGQYVYADGINSGVYVLPEEDLTLEITRLAASSSSQGYIQYGGGGADGSQSNGVSSTHTIKGGSFNINITAPPLYNEYTYQFRLINLPTGATDSTSALCDGTTTFGCGTFMVKVDGEAPEISSNTWTVTDRNDEVLGDILPSSTMNCVNVEAIVEENAALLAGEVQLRWGYYVDYENNLTWPVYGQRFGAEPQFADLSVQVLGGDDYKIYTPECIDLWPDPITPTQEQITSIDIIMWVEGSDSAGWSLDGGGPNSAGGISSIYSSDSTHNSMYRLIHEEAKFIVTDVRMNPVSPEVGDTAVLEVSLRNTGTMDGNLTIEIQSVIGDDFPTTEFTFTTGTIAQGATSDEFITLEKFTTPTTGMYFLVVNAETNEILWNGSSNSKSFNVAVESEDEGLLSGMGMLVVIGLAALILILLVVVVVLVRRDTGDETYEYEYEEDMDVKQYAEIPQAVSPAANVDPIMAQAMQEFPQWDQATIQGYFDQGWDIASLRDWVNNQ